MFNRLLVGVDINELEAGPMWDAVVALQKQFSSAVILTHVQSGLSERTESRSAHQHRIRSALDEARREVTRRGGSVTSVAFDVSSPMGIAVGMHDFARSERCDVIVVGHRNNAGWRRMFSPSTSADLVSYSPTALLVVPLDLLPPRPKIFERIAVGIDGSTTSRRALSWALLEAQRRRAAVHCVHSQLIPTFAGVGDMGAVVPLDAAPFRQAAKELVETERHWASTFLPGDAPVTAVGVEETVLGALADASNEADLLVIGRHSSSRVGQLIGSVALDMLSHSSCPVVVVDPGNVFASDYRPTQIVVGIDGSYASDAALDWAADEAETWGVPLVVVHAWTGHADPHPHESAFQQLNEAIARRDGFPDHRLQVQEGRPSQTLLEISAANSILVVGDRGRNKFSSLLLGSVAHDVAVHADCPTVVVPS